MNSREQGTTDEIPLALYLHIPFCRRRCTYCDYNTYAGLEDLFAPYTHALTKKIQQAGCRERVNTVFIGGGTPSLLPLNLAENLLAACRDAFFVADDAEITMEANPGTVDRAKLEGLRQLGVNRLSFGVQSALSLELRLLGRLHTFEQAIQAVAMARAVGFDNVSLDLIYGLPNQSLQAWRTTLDANLALSPDHLSCYCLTVEDGTLLADWVASHSVPLPDPDLAADMYEFTEEALGKTGFVHYEISNWAKPGRECRHNLVYWKNRDYLGFGVGAHSHRDGRRWWNVLAPGEFIARVEAGQTTEADGEEIGPSQAMGETIMMGLRLGEGVSADAFHERFEQDLGEVYARELGELVAAGLLEWDSRRIRLTARGRLLGNQVFARFLR